jgi:hypothetical protein
VRVEIGVRGIGQALSGPGAVVECPVFTRLLGDTGLSKFAGFELEGALEDAILFFEATAFRATHIR